LKEIWSKRNAINKGLHLKSRKRSEGFLKQKSIPILNHFDMKTVFYFKTEIAKNESDGSSAFRYPLIQSVLQGYVKTCTQRTHTFVTELWTRNAGERIRDRIIFPLGNSASFSRSARKAFMTCENVYGIYFDNLPRIEVAKLDSYLRSADSFLGSCMVHFISEKVLKFHWLSPTLKIKNKRVSILIDQFQTIDKERDIILEEVIKHIPFDSWNYEERERNCFASSFSLTRDNLDDIKL